MMAIPIAVRRYLTIVLICIFLIISDVEHFFTVNIISICCLVTQSCPILYDLMDCSTPGFLVLHHLPEFVQTHDHWVGDAIEPSYLCFPLLLLPSVFPSIGVFSNELALCIRWPKYWSFNFSIRPSNKYLGLISFRIDWFGLLAIQGTLKSLHQHHNLKASILQYSAIFIVQLSQLYMTTRKARALTRRTFVGKVMSLLFNMLSRFVIVFLPRSKCLLISWLQSPSAVILEPKKIKFVTVSIVSPSICHEMIGLDALILVFWMLSFKPAFSLSSFSFLNNSSSLSVFLRLLIFLLAILIPACVSSSSAFHTMYYAYKLNKQGDDIQPSCTKPKYLCDSLYCNVHFIKEVWPQTHSIFEACLYSCFSSSECLSPVLTQSG